jgi:hypothetical protein
MRQVRQGQASGFPTGRYILDPGDLDHPCHVRAVDAVADKPGGEFAPLVRTAAIDGQTGLRMLVLGLHQVASHLLQSQERSARPGVSTSPQECVDLWDLGRGAGYSEKNEET